LTERSDKEDLIRAALVSGDAGAFDLIWDEYGRTLFGLMLSILGSHHDAEEALQEVFVRIARNKDRVAGAGNIAGYIYMIARNEGLSFRKKNRRLPVSSDPADFWLVPAKSEEKFNDEALLIADALGRLPEEQRTVIIMKVYRDMTFQEIAAALELSLNTAASRYRYGVDKLRELLSEKGMTG